MPDPAQLWRERYAHSLREMSVSGWALHGCVPAQIPLGYGMSLVIDVYSGLMRWRMPESSWAIASKA